MKTRAGRDLFRAFFPLIAKKKKNKSTAPPP